MKTSRIIALTLAVVIAVSAFAMLSGCGKGDTAATTAAPTVKPTVAATTAATAAAQDGAQNSSAQNSSAQDNNAQAQQDATSGDSNEIGISREEAIANVKKQEGSGAQIISCEEGTSPEGFRCYVIVVSPISASEEVKTVTYYSGYLFCYSEEEYDPDQASKYDPDSEVGISETDAISSVRSQVGDAAEIVSIEQGTSSEGFSCYVIVVSVQSDNGEFVNETYYAGYQFCYKAN